MYTAYKRQSSVTLGGQYHVLRVGTDSSSRPIFMSERMWGAWLAVMEDVGDGLANKIDIVQGAFMKFAGGGADASGGYHDLSSCLDTRTWDLTAEEEGKLIRRARARGWAVWKRDQAHGGFDEHMHWTLLDEFRGVEGGGAQPSASGAIFQWKSYRNGNDGLIPEHNDYHWRPKPIPVFNLKEYRKEEDVDLQELMDHQIKDDPKLTVAEALRAAEATQTNLDQFIKRWDIARKAELVRDGRQRDRDKALADTIAAIAADCEDDATQAQLVQVGNTLMTKLQNIDDQVS